jgi:hypothetical protein
MAWSCSVGTPKLETSSAKCIKPSWVMEVSELTSKLCIVLWVEGAENEKC